MELSPEIYTLRLWSVDFQQRYQDKWRKNSLFNKWSGDNWIFTCKRMNLGPFLILHAKTNTKWIIDPNVRAKTMKLLEENINKFSWPWVGQAFLDTTPKAQVTEGKVVKLDVIKVRNFCAPKYTITKVKRQHSEWEKIFTNHVW